MRIPDLIRSNHEYPDWSERRLGMIIDGRKHRGFSQRRGVVLVAVLVVVAVLMLVGYTFHRWMRAEADAVQAGNRLIQGRHLADSGLDYAAFILAHPEQAGLGDAGGAFPDAAAIYHNPDAFRRRPVHGANETVTGSFSIIAPREPDDPLSSSQGIRFGVEDEAGKLNVNALGRMDPQSARDMLSKLPGMTRETADAILNWVRRRDQNTESAFGDQLYYAGLGYALKNGPLESAEEMLLVRGITPRLFLGNDQNRNGILEPEEDDHNGVLDPGLGRFLTLYSRERNVNAGGEPRIWINDPDLEGLHAKLVAEVGEELATFIIGYRLHARSVQLWTIAYTVRLQEAALVEATVKQNDLSEELTSKRALVRAHLYLAGVKEKKPTRIVEGAPRFEDLDLSRGPGQDISSVMDLFDGEFQMTPPGEEEAITYRSPLKKDKLDLLRDRLPVLLDRLTTNRAQELEPRINLNTAPREVLRTLPGLSEADVQVILDQRPAADMDPGQADRYRTPAWLVTEAGFSLDTLRSLESYITTRSQVYRMQIIGQPATGTVASRIEAVVDTNAGRPRILYWRELTELGR